MDTQAFRWMETASGMAKTSRWSTAGNGALPREAWYYGPRLGRTELTEDFLDRLRLELWGAKRARVIAGIDAKLDESLTINGVPMLRVTMPGRFVPHFDADETTFYLYKAVAGGTVVDFGRLWGGPVADERRRESPLTRMGIIAADETPSPRGVIVAERARAEADAMHTDPVTTEVEAIPDRPPPRIAARLRGDDGSREPQAHHAVRPSNPTCVPEADDSPDASNPRGITSALRLFETNEADGDDDVARPVRPKPTAPTTEPDDPFAATDAPPVNYGYVAAMSSLVAMILVGLCYAAWTFLSLD